MKPETKAVDQVLPAVRALFAAAGVPFKIVGGVAVVHHGYARLTDDIDLLVDPSVPNRLDDLLNAHGFRREAADRLRHEATGVGVDLLLAGHPMPRPGSPLYPLFDSVESSPSDPDVAGLRSLLELKLYARRHKDLADVVELLKGVDDGVYVALEGGVAVSLRSELAALRRDAIEELRFERRGA